MELNNLTDYAKFCLSTLDLTSLNDSDCETSIKALVTKSNTDFGSPAALCIYPDFIEAAKKQLKSLQLSTPIATVTNFPFGYTDEIQAYNDAQRALALGANEIDVVIPWQAIINGDTDCAASVIAKTKEAIGELALLKVIIESGSLKTPALIRTASEIAIDNGADFIKTSTGKVELNATLNAADIMLDVIKEKDSNIGLKVSGGIKTVAQAKEYIDLSVSKMGIEWMDSSHIRIGASSLLNDIIFILEQN